MQRSSSSSADLDEVDYPLPDPTRGRRSLPIACRFVPWDKWFFTHIDTSWKIKQVKHWLLSKCNAIEDDNSERPRFRPASPVTFSSQLRPSADSVINSRTSTSGDDEDDEDWEVHPYDYNQGRRTGAASGTSVPSAGVRPTSSEHLRSWDTPELIKTEYDLISFSNGYIFEDEGDVTWYDLQPGELLEIHDAGHLVDLNRDNLTYVEPHFHSMISLLVPAKRSANTGHKSRGSWKARCVIVEHGNLILCNDYFSEPFHTLPMSNLLEVQGSEPLEDSSRKNRYNIVSCRFQGSASGNEGSSREGSVWVVLDLPNERARESLLRLLHILSTRLEHTSFIPSWSARIKGKGPPIPAIFNSSNIRGFGVSYPDWRIALVDRAREAGLGEISPAMKVHLHAHTRKGSWPMNGFKPKGFKSSPYGVHKELVAHLKRRAGAGQIPPLRDFGSVYERPDEPNEEDSDDDDPDSEVEWDGWAQELVRRASTARLYNMPSSPTSSGPSPVPSLSVPSITSTVSTLTSSWDDSDTLRIRNLSLEPEQFLRVGESITTTYIYAGDPRSRSRSSTISVSGSGHSSSKGREKPKLPTIVSPPPSSYYDSSQYRGSSRSGPSSPQATVAGSSRRSRFPQVTNSIRNALSPDRAFKRTDEGSANERRKH